MNTPVDAGLQRPWLQRWGWTILVAVVLLLFVRSLSPDVTMAQGDTSVLGMRFAYGSLPYGVIARWEPCDGMGQAGTALGLTPSTLLGWIVSYRKSVDVNYLFHLILFGVGGWFLLRDMTRSAVAALVGGLWFMLQAHAFSHMQPGHLGYFWTCAWMPWAILFLRLAVRQGHMAWWLLAGACAGLTLTGQPDIGVLFVMFVAAYGVFLTVQEGVRQSAAGQGVRRYAARVAAGGVLAGAACLLLGFQILVGSYRAFGPQAPASSHVAAGAKSVADQEREQWLWATQWSVPPEESLDFVIPGLFGWGSSHPVNRYRGRIGQTEGFFEHGKGMPNLNDVSNYVGALMVLACVIAVVARKKRGEVWFLVAAGLTACLLSFGKYAPLYRLFYELPYMSSMRNPIKWFAMASLCVGMLGSIGLAEAVSRETALARSSFLQRLALCFVPGVVVVAAGAIFLSSIGSGPQWMFWQDPKVVDMAWGSLRTGAFFWAVAGGLFFWILRDRAAGAGAEVRRSAADRFFPVAAAVLVLVEVLYVDLRYMPCNPQMDIRGDAVTEYLNSQKRPFRILLTRMDGVYRYINDVFCPYYGWERPTVAVSRTEDASATFMRGIGNMKKWLQLANVHYILSPGRMGDADFVPVASVQYGSTPVIVNRFTNALPRYYVVGRWEVVPEDKALERMASPEFDPRQSVLLHGTPEGVPAQAGGPWTATCEVTEYSRRGTTVRTRSSHPAVMVGLERYDGSWAVFVDGKAAPMWKANWMLRACPVPAGEHTVEWRVVGDGGVGFWVGVAGWAVVAAAVLWLAVGRWLAARKA